MAIDNPIEAFKKTHPEEEGNLPQDLVILAAELALPNSNTKLHPNTFIHRRQELAEEMAREFGMKTDLGMRVFSHEEGYEACTRLQGFGLAHEIDLSPREVPVGDYCFRPSKRGLLLLKLTGEQVANWEKYFPSAGITSSATR